MKVKTFLAALVILTGLFLVVAPSASKTASADSNTIILSKDNLVV